MLSSGFLPNRFRRLTRVAPVVFLFALSLLIRIWNLDADPAGDEGYYYYLALFPEKYLSLHRNHPPLLYLAYHFFAWDFTVFRLVNVLVGSLIPVLVYLLLDSYSIRKELRILGGVVAATNIILVKYSGIVFLDTLSAAFLLSGLIFYRRKGWALVGLMLGLAVLTKEYAALAALPIVVGSWLRYRSPKITVQCASGLILALGVVYYILFPMKGILDLLGGVAHGDPLSGAWNIVLLLSAIPALVIMRKGFYEEGVILVLYGFFIFFWGTHLDWYLVLPIPLIIVSAIIGFAWISSKLNSMEKKQSSIVSANWLTRKALAVILILYLVILSSPLETYAYVQTWHPHGLRDVTSFLREHYPGGAITLEDCFWAYELYPFGVQYVPLHKDYTSPTGEFNLTYYESHILDTGLAVFCFTPRPAGGLRDRLLERFRNFTVYSKDNFIVIALPNRKTTAYAYEPQVSLEIVDETGRTISNVRMGERIFFRGRLIDSNTKTPLVGEWVHLYAFVGSVLSPTPEWDSERTDSQGYYDTSWVGYPQPDNQAEWIEVKQDGLYKNGVAKVWTGNPIGQTITAYAEMWGLGGETSASYEVFVEGAGATMPLLESQYSITLILASVVSGVSLLIFARRLRAHARGCGNIPTMTEGGFQHKRSED